MWAENWHKYTPGECCDICKLIDVCKGKYETKKKKRSDLHVNVRITSTWKPNPGDFDTPHFSQTTKFDSRKRLTLSYE